MSFLVKNKFCREVKEKLIGYIDVKWTCEYHQNHQFHLYVVEPKVLKLVQPIPRMVNYAKSSYLFIFFNSFCSI